MERFLKLPGGPEKLREQLQAELEARHLNRFIRAAWHVIEPETEYNHGWHIDAMSEHIEACFNGQIRDLLINLPPRHMKSIEVAVALPAWRWAKHPGTQFLFSSYGDDLSTRDSLKCRKVIKSPWYQSRWGCPDPSHKLIPYDQCPAVFHLSQDQDTKHYFTNDRGGHRVATSVDAATTGFGGDVLVMDDPHNIQEAESEIERENAVRYVSESWGRRGNDPRTVIRIIIMQRVHEHDVSDSVLTKGGWVHLCLPAEHTAKGYSYEKRHKPAPSPVNWSDPRTEEGQLLWEERFGPAEIAQAKKDMSERAYSGQFLQRPYGLSGEMFDVEKLKTMLIDRLPSSNFYLTVRAWDLASSTKPGAKRTAGIKIAKDDKDRYYIVHVACDKKRPDKRNEWIKNTADSDGNIQIKVEHEGGSSGDDQELYLTKELSGHRVEFIRVSGDKAVRAESFASQCNVGNVYIVDDGSWDVDKYLDELRSFPEGTYLDQVDGSSLGFNFLKLKKVERINPAKDRRPQNGGHWQEQIGGMQEGLGVSDGDWRDKL